MPRKHVLHGGYAAMHAELKKYEAGWRANIGGSLPPDAPLFGEIEKAVLAAAKAWTPWR